MNDLSTISETLKKNNLKTIKSFIEYTDYAFSIFLINRTTEIVRNLIIQPEIFPTMNKSIQLEYEKLSGEYLEFEVFQDKIICFTIDSKHEEKEEILSDFSYDDLNEKIKSFIGEV